MMYVRAEPKWRLAVGVGEHCGKCQREQGDRRQTLTSAVVVRVDDAAQPPSPPPAKAPAGVAAMVMGATTHGPQRGFFRNFCQRTRDVRSGHDIFMLMDQTEDDRTFLKRP